MIIHNIPYVQVANEVTCSMSACLAMLLSYYNQPIHATDVSELFGSTFMSQEFHWWNVNTLDIDKYEESEMMSCGQYLINNRFSSLTADVISTDINKIMLSYIKRHIPVIVTGTFPLVSGKISNTILMKGYADGYFIVNDPTGNANSGYRDRYGENILYNAKDLARWFMSDKVCLLRIQPAN